MISNTAIRLSNLGFSISPPLVPGPDKGRTVERWKPYQTTRASLDQISRWYSLYPNHNYAVITGKVSGIVVLDADDEAAEALVARLCPPTPVVQVSGGGRGKHYIYRHPMDRDVRNVQKITYNGERYNLDVRGDGGLFVGPGSIHERTKQPYKELTPWSQFLLSRAPVYNPRWFGTVKKKEKVSGWMKMVPQNQWKHK